MKKTVIKELSNPELIDKLQEEKAQFTKLKIGHAVTPLENPMQIRASRKVIARLKTEISARELKAANKQ